MTKKIQCIGSKTPGIKNHNLVHVIPDSPNFLCVSEKCQVLYYNFKTKIWTYRPGFKAEALKTSLD